ncbi:unnamed protein product [Cochlearia groenlandica]
MLKAPKSYALEGFLYQLLIWAMVAIPIVGKLLGTKLTTDFVAGPRCSNWVSYVEIKLEMTITSVNSYNWSKHVWEAEERVKTSSIPDEQEEPDVDMENEDVEDDFHTPMPYESLGYARGKKRLPDYGFEKSKHKLLFERSKPPQLVLKHLSLPLERRWSRNMRR